MAALLIGATTILAALLATRPALGRPTFAGGTASWTGDDLAVACLWWAALIGSLWLAATTLACIAALARGRTRAAHCIARFAPPMVRRVLQAALVGGWALVPAAAYAAPPPSVPITVHVDAGGRLTTDTRRAPATEAPIARTPEPRHVTSTTSRSTTTTSPPEAALPTRPTRTVNRSERSPAPVPARVHVVQPGDNLWQIARAEAVRAGGTDRPADAQIAPYWRRVIAANRTTLRSGDPSLIFPGEVVALP
jgi:hypothetical protein